MGTFSEAGSSGIGSMILVIAIILVSSLAAGLLFTSGSELARLGKRAGDDSSSRTATRLSVSSLIAFDGAEDQDVDDLYITVGHFSGSEPVSLRDLVLVIQTSDDRATLSYVSSLFGEDSLHFTCEKPSALDGGSSEVGCLLDPSGMFTLERPILTEGSEIQLHIDVTSALGVEIETGKIVDLYLEIKNGLSDYIRFSIPQVLLQQLTVLK